MKYNELVLLEQRHKRIELQLGALREVRLRLNSVKQGKCHTGYFLLSEIEPVYDIINGALLRETYELEDELDAIKRTEL